MAQTVEFPDYDGMSRQELEFEATRWWAQSRMNDAIAHSNSVGWEKTCEKLEECKELVADMYEILYMTYSTSRRPTWHDMRTFEDEADRLGIELNVFDRELIKKLDRVGEMV